MLQIHILKLHFQFIHVVVRSRDGHIWNLTVVYASPKEGNKKCLWKDHEYIAHNMSTGWLVVGDFNDILHMKEAHEELLLLDTDATLSKLESLSALLWT